METIRGCRRSPLLERGVSAHEWRNAIGDPVWNVLRPSDIGTDEFMTLCKLLDVGPEHLRVRGKMIDVPVRADCAISI